MKTVLFPVAMGQTYFANICMYNYIYTDTHCQYRMLREFPVNDDPMASPPEIVGLMLSDANF